MTIEVRIPTILRTFTNDARAVEAEGADVRSLIADLDAKYEGIAERLLENAEVRRFVNIYVNDEDIRFTGGLETSLSDGDTVVILPAVAGGC